MIFKLTQGSSLSERLSLVPIKLHGGFICENDIMESLSFQQVLLVPFHSLCFISITENLAVSGSAERPSQLQPNPGYCPQ